MLSQRSDFAEKQHNLALGSQESTITELQMVGGLWESKIRCIDTTPNTSRCHGGMGADKNCTGPEKAGRVRETAGRHYRNNMHYFALAVFVMPSRSRAINLAGEPLIHFVRGSFSAWLDCDASMRNVK